MSESDTTNGVNNATVDTADGLLVTVVDPTATWTRFHLPNTLPLGRLDWLRRTNGVDIKESSSGAVKAKFSIQPALLADKVPFAPHQWFAEPYVYIYTVDLSTLDGKESESAWKALASFVAWCRNSKVEYLVLYPADDRALKQYRRVVGRLRMEVNINGKDKDKSIGITPIQRRTELGAQGERIQIPSAYYELVKLVSEYCGEAVRNRTMRYDEEVARMYANRKSSGWKYTDYFAVKEGLAFLFSQVGRRDLALKQYDELSNYPFVFETFCDPADGSDAAPIFTSRELWPQYRTRLLEGTINELDFRSYLFASQMSLLFHDRKYNEIGERAIKFITSVTRRCGEKAKAVGKGELIATPFFKDTWVFSVARYIAGSLAPAISTPSASSGMISSQLPTTKERQTARMLAGFHVQALKAFSSLCARVLPKDLWPSEFIVDDLPPGEIDISPDTISNRTLKTALADKAKAGKLHSELSYAAASLYEMGGRERGAAALDGDAGVVRLKLGAAEEAKRLLSAQCARFSSDTGWDQLHYRRRIELANAQKEVGDAKDYLFSCLSLLSMTREIRQLTLRNQQDDDHEFYTKQASHWASEIMKTAAKLPQTMRYKAEHLLAIGVKANRSLWCEGEAGSCTVTIESDIPTIFSIDSIRLELRYHGIEARSSGFRKLGSEAEVGDSDAMALVKNLHLSSSTSVSVNPGLTEVVVTADMIPYAGRYTVIHVVAFVGKLKLVQAAGELNAASTVVMRGTRRSASGSGLPVDSERFPAMFSLAKIPEAKIEAEPVYELCIAPHITQSVDLVIHAGTRGIAKGARVQVNLRNCEDVKLRKEGCYFSCEAEEKAEVRLEKVDQLQDDGQAVDLPVPKEIAAQETITLHLGIETLEGSARIDSCSLCLAFTHREMGAMNGRDLTLTKDISLIFVTPINAIASFRICTPRDLSTVNVDLDAKMTGTLQFGIQSNLQSLTLHSVDLVVPSWLEVQGNPPHAMILPYTLIEGSLFTCAWDVSILFENIRDLDRETSRLLVQRVHSRPIVSNDMILDNSEDISNSGQDEAETSTGMHSNRTGKRPTSGILPELHNGLEGTAHSNPEERSSAKVDEGDFTEIVIDDSPTTSQGGEHLGPRESLCERTRIGEEHGIHTNEDGGDDLILIKVDLSIGDSESRTVIERSVHLDTRELRSRRYLVKRASRSISVVGVVVPIEFQVIHFHPSAEAHDLSMESRMVLEYEVAFDPTEWLVLGLRRAQIQKPNDRNNLTIDVLPLIPGRLKLPTLRLFEPNGLEVPPARVNLENEGFQIIVVAESLNSRICESSKVIGGSLGSYAKTAAAATAAAVAARKQSTKRESQSGLPAVLPSDLVYET